MYSIAHPSSPCNSCSPIPGLQNIPRPAATLTAASQQHTARNLHASHQLIQATQDRPDLPVQAQPVIRPLSQAPTPRWSAVTQQSKAKGTGHDTGASMGAVPSPASGWSEVVTLDLLQPCLQLLRQGQVIKALDLLQQLTIQHGPPDRDTGDNILLVRPSLQTFSL